MIPDPSFSGIPTEMLGRTAGDVGLVAAVRSEVALFSVSAGQDGTGQFKQMGVSRGAGAALVSLLLATPRRPDGLPVRTAAARSSGRRTFAPAGDGLPDGRDSGPGTK